ncbi:MAG: ribonuclease J [Candidatus Izemoplasma sp.]|nr:ribonuclease J [Candidatus Izemoplasma sp.]
MSKIKFFALGGLGEDGKNMYLIDINNKLFILDAGLKYPTQELFGVDCIIPDLSYIEQHKDRIAGLFLSHGHEDHIGAVNKLLKIVNPPIYGSSFTLEILKDSLKDDDISVDDLNMFTVDGSKTMRFDDITVDFFRVTHSIPETLGIAINTPDGTIVYAADYSFNQSVSMHYKTDYAKLSQIAGRNILALLTESLGADQMNSNPDNTQLDYALNQAFMEAESRIIVSAFSTDLSRIQKVIDIALKYDKDIAIIGRKTQRIVDIAVNLGYLPIPKDKLKRLRFIDDHNKNELKNGVVLVAGERHEPFYMLQRMVKKIDRLIHINQADTIISLTPPIPGTENIAARTLDILYRNDVNMIKIDKSILPKAHASANDIQLLVNMLEPRYIVPIIGEYRHQYAVKDIMMQMGYSDNNIITLENGEVATFINGKIKDTSERYKTDDFLVDGILEGDLSDVVLRDREMLAQDGVMLLIANVDARKKVLVSEPEVVSRGFVYMKENEDLIDDVKEAFKRISEKEFKGGYINWRDYKKHVRDEIGNFLYNKTKRRPILIPVLIDTQL